MQNDEWAKTIVDSVFDVILVVDGEMNVIDVNHQVGETGYVSDEVVGKSIFDLLVRPDDIKEQLKVVVDDNGIDDGLVRTEIKRKDGTTYWSDTGIRKLTGTKEIDYLFIFHNVDERHKARRALEEQKAIIESALQEADRLRKEAEDSKLALELANEQLSKRQALTEAELMKEQTFRLNSQKTDFQRNFSTVLVGLVAMSIVLPYLSSFWTVAEKITDNTSNLTLIMLQLLGIVVGAIFGAQKKNGEKEN